MCFVAQEHNLEGCAHPYLGCYVDMPVLQIYEFLHQIEPDAGAGFLLRGIDFVVAAEALKQHRTFIFRDTDTGV